MSLSRLRRYLRAPEVVTPLCPICHSEPALMIGVAQWFCENEDCEVTLWCPTVDAAEQLAKAHRLEAE